MQIGEVTHKTGIPASTLRYYEAIGLIPAPKRANNGRRQYDETVLQYLAMIKTAQNLGFTLTEIKSLMADTQSNVSNRWHPIALQKLADLDALIAQAEATKARLKQGLKCQCDSMDDCEFSQPEHFFPLDK